MPFPDPHRVEALIEVATARQDAADDRAAGLERRLDEATRERRDLELRVRAAEVQLAEARGASSGWSRVVPALSLLVALGALLWNVLGR